MERLRRQFESARGYAFGRCRNRRFWRGNLPGATFTMSTLISHGAEAKLFLEGNAVKKHRFPKSYRIRELDDALRGMRTRREAKILTKLEAVGFPAPRVISTDNKEQVVIGYIEGRLLKDALTKKNCAAAGREMGGRIAFLHNHGIIHGDLTTSNMILRKGKKEIFFIDFGLSFISLKDEDRAVDLHVLKEALESKHHAIAKECFAHALQSYAKEAKGSAAVLKRLQAVERRGRYRAKKGN